MHTRHTMMLLAILSLWTPLSLAQEEEEARRLVEAQYNWLEIGRRFRELIESTVQRYDPQANRRPKRGPAPDADTVPV